MTAAARKLALACAMSASLFSTPSHAVVFTEVVDAGQTQPTAQVGAGTPGALTDILGSLDSVTDLADLYIIDIVNPGAFSATTVNGLLDTQLFLLTLSGAPVFLNDDDAGAPLSLGSTLPAGSFGSLAAGRYLLGVSLSGYNPVNSVNQLLFASGLPTDLRGPAFGLQPAFLGGFSDDGVFADAGTYDIQLTGVAAIPEPATNALLLVGGALLAFVARRRRGVAANTAA